MLDQFVCALLAQVTVATAASLILIWCARRKSAFGHAARVVGIVLVVLSPFLVLALPRPGWLHFDQMSSARPTRVPQKPVAVTVHTPFELAAVKPQENDFHSRIPAIDGPGMEEGSPAVDPPMIDSLATDPSTPDALRGSMRTPVPLVPQQDVALRSSGRSVSSLSLVVKLVGGLWCLGVVFVAIRQWQRRNELRVVTRSCVDACLGQTGHVATEVCGALGLKELPPIRISELAPLPFVVGLWKPIVVLPRQIAEQASYDRLRQILIHEFAHILRRDPWVHLLQRFSAILFWLHPGVHWLNRQIARTREELCDNFVLRNGDAAEYAQTLLDLAESCRGQRIRLAELSLFPPRWTLEQRIGGLLDPSRSKSTKTRVGAKVVLALVFGLFSVSIGGIGLVAAKVALDANVTQSKSRRTPATRKISVRGKCVDDDGHPVANARVRVLEDGMRIRTFSGPGSDPVSVIAEGKTDADGQFVFNDVEASGPSPFFQLRKMLYLAAIADGRASAVQPLSGDGNEFGVGSPEDPFILSSDRQNVSGIVTDTAGRPVAGAHVFMGTLFGNAMPGIWSSITDQEGRYTIDDLERWKKTVREGIDPDGDHFTMTETNTAAWLNSQVQVQHPDFASTSEPTVTVPNNINVRLIPAAIIQGCVFDQVTGQPAALLVVNAKGIVHDGFVLTMTDSEGRYRLHLRQDHYNIWVEADDRIATVLKAIEAAPGKTLKDADFQLVQGGFVVGTVIDDETDRPLVGSDEKPTFVAHYGPACVRFIPQSVAVGEPGLSIGVQQTTRVNPDGTFRLRVAPGRNAVFFLETYGEAEQSPQIVSVDDGHERKVELRVRLSSRDRQIPDKFVGEPIPVWTDDLIDQDMDRFTLLRREAKFEEAEADVKSGRAAKNPLSRIPSRIRRDSAVNRLLDKFERQSIGNERFRDPWLRTIKEIVDLGPAAVPDLIDELDATDDPWILQLMGFTLRAIKDRRAVPALIRAIPKTLPPLEPEKNVVLSLSDMEMLRSPATTVMVSLTRDPALAAFANASQVSPNGEISGYMYYGPVREICAALTKLTGARNGEEQLFDSADREYTSLFEMPAKQQAFHRVTNNWADWWQQHQNDIVAPTQASPNEARAIETIQQHGGKITRDGSSPGSPVSRVVFKGNDTVTNDDLILLKEFPNLQELFLSLNVNPPVGGMKIIGELHGLTVIHLSNDNRVGNRVIGEGLKELRHLTNLSALDLVGCDITNDDLKEVAQHQSLTKLFLSGNSLGDAGMKELRALSNLVELDLNYVKVTDAGLSDLAELKSLQKLELGGSKVTDAAWKELRRLSNLTYLDLSNTRLTGIGISELKDLKNLTSLNLESTRIRDASAKELSELKNLTYLRLSDTKITDEGLLEFKQLKNLRYLVVKETEVTRKACSELKQTLPHLQVDQ